MRRGFVLAVVFGLVAATLLGGTFRSQAQDTSSTASPAASPAGSPVGSPVAVAGDVEAGKALASQCLSCHSVDGSQMVGPTWKGLYGHEVELEDGTTVIADEAYLIESIKDPGAKIVKGFPAGAMPPYGAILTDEDIIDIVAYIRSLAGE
ncbi:MAG: c-type cytochrome [Thermomicrobiales bacterium]|nr:c-type cytochrome [Thermomicrobiales bacterium]MCO5221999.1 c-type cytochrome [Thermomicrobiales bacterium]